MLRPDSPMTLTRSLRFPTLSLYLCWTTSLFLMNYRLLNKLRFKGNECLYLLGISLTHTFAVVRTKSVPGGLLGLDMDNILKPWSINISCLIPGCSSLNTTCWVNLNHIRILPVSADIMYLKIYYHILLWYSFLRSWKK